MLKKIAALTVVVTVVSLSSTARADGWSWMTLGQRPTIISPEVHAPLKGLIVGAAEIETRLWTGKIKPEERARSHLNSLRNETRLPLGSRYLHRCSIVREYITPLWIQ